MEAHHTNQKNGVSLTMTRIRMPAIAGSFYSDTPHLLSHDVDTFLAEAIPQQAKPIETCPKALIIPHAGYIYSGAIAAQAYREWLPYRDSIQRIVLLGPAHRVYFKGIALSPAECFLTPLGAVKLDTERQIELLKHFPYCLRYHEEAHLHEHSLEIHLPFFQRLMGRPFDFLPLLVGDAAIADIAAIIEHFWHETNTVIAISSDLSHFLPYAHAKVKDRHTADKILNLDASLNADEACGCMPINGLLHLAHRLTLTPHLLDLRNSGDTAGDKHKVVGYGSFAFYTA